MNQVQIAGFVGSSPEFSEKTATFSVAVRGRKDSTMWFRCVTFSEFNRELVKKFIEKGSFVCISGSLELSSFEKDGVVSNRCSVIVEHITLGPQRTPSVDFETGEIIEPKVEEEKSKNKAANQFRTDD